MCRINQTLEGVGAKGLLDRIGPLPEGQREGQPAPQGHQNPPGGSQARVDLERTRLAIRNKNRLFRGKIKRAAPQPVQSSWRQATQSSVSNLVFRTHNIGKKPPLPFIVHHFKEGVHLLALQEVNMCTKELSRVLMSTFPGATLFGHTNGRSNGSILVIHPTLAPFVRPLTCPNLNTINNVHECIAAATVTIPKEPTFHVFGIYISGYDARAREDVASTITPWLDTPWEI